MGQRPNRYHNKEDTQMENKHMRKCSTYHQGNANYNNKEIPLYIYQHVQNPEHLTTPSAGKDVE